MASETSGGRSGSLGKYLLYLVLLGGLILLAVQFWPSMQEASEFRRIPKEMQVTYMPSDYSFEIDEEDAVAILTNPRRYRREFNDLVRDLNLSILEHVSRRMGLQPQQRRQVLEEYEEHHSYLRNLYFRDFIAIQDTTSNMARTWYADEGQSATRALHRVASKYTCFLVNHIITSVVPNEEGRIFGRGREVETPCGIATAEALQPVIERMEKSAKIRDFSSSRGMLEERVEKVITELGTYEVQSKKGLTKRLQTKMWGFSVSSTDLEISAVSVMKIGFKLERYFNIDLNPRNKVVTVTLPPPSILSHAVYPKMDKMDIGWLREVKEVDLNESFNLLRDEFVREANRENAMEKAKDHAREVMGTMIGPVINAFDPGYRLDVRFQSPKSETAEFEPTDEFTDL